MATRHIIERGFDSVSVNDLAEDLGMSVGGLYRYIQTKSDLLVMACETIYGGLRERLAEIATGSGQDLPEKLRLMIEAYISECVRNREQILLMYREYRHLPQEAHRRYKERELGIAGLFADVIGAGIRQGVFGQVHVQVVAQDIVLMGHLPALKGWALRGVESDVVVAEQVELVMARLTAGRGQGSSPARRAASTASCRLCAPSLTRVDRR
ncbi:TetR family transcriptional regulator [Prescottella defluvii]|nr:TetR family transcriptional regulator [Prescottella defluvii]